jgi:hypothetical protein
MEILGLAMLLAPIMATPAAAPPAKPVVYVMAVEEGKVVCRRVTEAHSRIPVRVCRTELQWEEMSRDNQEDIRRRDRTRG